MGPEEMLKFTFAVSNSFNVLGEKHLNTQKIQKFESVMSDFQSPKTTAVGRSV